MQNPDGRRIEYKWKGRSKETDISESLQKCELQKCSVKTGGPNDDSKRGGLCVSTQGGKGKALGCYRWAILKEHGYLDK